MLFDGSFKYTLHLYIVHRLVSYLEAITESHMKSAHQRSPKMDS